ncbi:YetF domain-containing protein [Methyloligella sp. 2.7D]|uniref:DUF421 domain-containing protein n=1 Tax=unclassified Methyloligella TaxID=2625955 RepID=UPI00157DFD48|nr:YetF domain-containing protein [Methyloligella sp. GL2]QKP76290.1 DUF421 domain-containing protein [Methyloligella sp. GL2]
MDTLNTIFGVTGQVSLAQECARAAIIFLYGLLLIRLSGRRTFGTWSALDVIVSVTAGSALSRALTGNSPLFGTMAAVAVLMALHWLLAQIVSRNRQAADLLEGRPIVLVQDGQVNEKERTRHGVSDYDIAEALHRCGIQSMNEAQLITLAPNGTINVIPKKA